MLVLVLLFVFFLFACLSGWLSVCLCGYLGWGCGKKKKKTSQSAKHRPFHKHHPQTPQQVGKTPLQKKLEHLGKVLVGLAAFACALVVAAGLAWDAKDTGIIKVGVSLAHPTHTHNQTQHPKP